MTITILLVLMTFAFAAGGAGLKQYAVTGGHWWLLAAAIAYLAGNALYIQVLRSYDLGVATVLSAMAQIVIMSLAGRFLFAESLSTTQVVGIVLGLLAMAMVLLPGSNT